MPLDPRTQRKLIKADRLVADGRMHRIGSSGDGRWWIGVADGEQGRYLVCVVSKDAIVAPGGGEVPPRFSCQCDDYRRHPAEPCKHAIAGNKLRMAEEAGGVE